MAAIIGAVLVSGVGGFVGGKVKATVCGIFGGSGCARPASAGSTPPGVHAWRPDDGSGRARGGRPRTVEQQVERVMNMLDFTGEEGEELFMTHVEQAIQSCALSGLNDDECWITRSLGTDPDLDAIDVDDIDEYHEAVALAALYLWTEAVADGVIEEVDDGMWMPTECAPTCMTGQSVENLLMNGNTDLPIEELLFETFSEMASSPGNR